MTYTRKQYMEDYSAVFARNPDVKTPFHELRGETEALHRRYYAQFVNSNTIAAVVSHFGAARLRASTNRDGAFNDIPLKLWDSCPLYLAARLETAGDYLTPAGKVCILKEAACQWLARHEGVTS